MLSKQARLAVFLERLNALPSVSNEKEALNLLERELNRIEDEFTSIAYLPEQWKSHGRMYPPQADSRRTLTSEVSRYRNRNHNTYIGMNGSIRIETVYEQRILLDKPGMDERKVSDL